MLHKLFIQVGSILVYLTLLTPVAGQEYRYALIELPSLNQERQYDGVSGINAAGDVAGGSSPGGFLSRALFWPHDGGFIDLGTLGGDHSGASDINELRHVCGTSRYEPGNPGHHAFLWRDGQMIDLGTLGGRDSVAWAVNDLGQVVGQATYVKGSFSWRAFLWENGVMEELSATRPDRVSIAAWDINNSGEIVGEAEGASYRNAHLWRDGQVFDLGSLAGRGSAAYAINDLGHIAGISNSSQQNRLHAVVWIDGRIVDIHPRDYGPQSGARDINNNTQVVGWVGDIFGITRAFLRESSQPPRLLDDLVPPLLELAWRLYDARAINDAGQIAAVAEIDGQPGNTWAMLLSPVSPTLSLAAPQPGRAGESNRLRVTGCTPGARVTFLYSRFGGGARIPGCDLQRNALQLDSPTVIGTAIADQSGVATITRTVPPIARNQIILFQAVVQSECAISQLVVHRFE